LPTEDLQTVMKNLALPRNRTLDSTWYLHNMRLDPVKWYGGSSYILMIIVTVQILLYTYKAELIKVKQELVQVCKANVVAPAPIENDANVNLALERRETKSEIKFMEKKSMIVSNGQTLILICMGFTFTVPMMVVRKISREQLGTINFGTGKAWVYINRIAVPTSYQLLFPLLIIVSNVKMRKCLLRCIKEFGLYERWMLVTSRIRSIFDQGYQLD